MNVLTAREQREIDQANASGRRPVVFVHGLWMLASSWQPWRELFESHGYATVAPGWPDDPETVERGRAHPEVFAGKTVRQVTDHMAEAIAQLNQQPAVVGHSFGGLITQQLAGRGLATASVAIDSAPFRGVLPLPLSALRSAWPVIGNAISDDECQQHYAALPVAGSGIPLFQAAIANFNPASQITVDTRNPKRGPMLIISGEKDHIAPLAIATASFKKQRRNSSPTEFVEIPNRGHSLVFDSGWHEVADRALGFLKQHLR